MRLSSLSKHQYSARQLNTLIYHKELTHTYFRDLLVSVALVVLVALLLYLQVVATEDNWQVATAEAVRPVLQLCKPLEATKRPDCGWRPHLA